ncbi:MAG: hypothetical protein AAF533_23755 [Acidobacteriota bacterium]
MTKGAKQACRWSATGSPVERELTTPQRLEAVRERYRTLIRHCDEARLSLDTWSPFAEALALGRLLLHFPVGVRRDPEVLAELATTAGEMADGVDEVDCHEHFRGLVHLRDHAESIGFTLVVHPVGSYQALWQSRDYLGEITSRVVTWRRIEAPTADDDLVLWAGDWAVEILIEAAEDQTNAKFLAGAERYFVNEGSSGLALSSGADGSVILRVHEQGHRDRARERQLTSLPELAESARALDPVGALVSLGHADLLEHPSHL